MVQTRCENCRHLVMRPDQLEQAIPGLNILSSAYGSVRDNTGLCRRHEVFTVSTSTCTDFESKQSANPHSCPDAI